VAMVITIKVDEKAFKHDGRIAALNVFQEIF
jgi:hypothetical protein